MKVLFLDIDGVLNWIDTADRVGPFIGICPERVARFNKIVEAHPDLKIVISSTWRHGIRGHIEDFEALKTFLASRGVKGEIIDHTPMHFGHRGRGNEIREWLEDCEVGLESFVILDDDTECMEPFAPEPSIFDKYGGIDDEVEPQIDLRPFHVITHWTGDPNVDEEEGGLLDKHVARAIEILNERPDES